MKRYWVLAIFACIVLSAAAVWLGGLNQDEGWYLYAANLVAEGSLPFRDYFFTQGPVMPIVYSFFASVWRTHGLLGARILTLAFGLLGVFLAVVLAARLSPTNKIRAALVAFFLLGTNLYHLYYLAIPKTYALAALFLVAGFLLLTLRERWSGVCAFAAGLSLAFAAGTRISLVAVLPVVSVFLILRRSGFWPFALGAALGLMTVYGPFLLDPVSRETLFAAQAYHAARGGSDPVWAVGSFSRLVRWYLPLFVTLGLGGLSKPTKETALLLLSFLAVAVVQILAPFPYEDYQVPVMGLLAVVAAVRFADVAGVSSAAFSSPSHSLLLVFGLAYATAFGSPLLEKWSTNGQDRFWSLKKAKSELAQLQDVAARIETLDPGGKTLLTQDLYLAVETNRKVPRGLEMGPFAMLTDDQWRHLLATARETCSVAALSGYTFAIEPPVCNERPVAVQLDYWRILDADYEPIFREEAFGQNATPLLVLKRK